MVAFQLGETIIAPGTKGAAQPRLLPTGPSKILDPGVSFRIFIIWVNWAFLPEMDNHSG
jgi:hypothetical protein